MIKLKEIRIQNFTCFLDEKVFFTEGLNIFSAKNGAGKSQFFNALYWNLFGQVYDKKKGFIKPQISNLIPDYFTNRKDTLESQKTEICLVIEGPIPNARFENTDKYQHVDYEFTRSFRWSLDNQNLQIQTTPSLTVSYVGQKGETEYIEEGLLLDFLEWLFPMNIRRFMWYVGETMKDLIDFESGRALENALEQISYFPKYKKLLNHIEASKNQISRKVEKEQRKANKLSKEQEDLISRIESNEKSIHSDKIELEELILLKKKILDDREVVESQLRSFDTFVEYEKKLTRLEYELASAKKDIDYLEQKQKEKLIGSWMINGCDHLVKEAGKKIKLIQNEIIKYQKSDNPIPRNLPGSDYVDQMIKDHKCHICERTFEENDDAHKALLKRLEDIDENSRLRLLNENYVDLNGFKNRIKKKLPTISAEIKTTEHELNKLIEKRNKTQKQINNLYTELDISENQKDQIEQGVSSAGKLTSKFKLLGEDLRKVNSKIERLESKIRIAENNLEEDQALRQNSIENDSLNIVEEKALPYINIIRKAFMTLKGEAYQKLIDEIEQTSNKLYDTYLSGNAPGKIVIKKDVRIVDFETEEVLEDLSTAQENGGKLSVINSILYLSEKKQGEYFPLIMDAPTSDYDPDNTMSITKNIASTFNQIIIMSKDYQQLEKEDIDNLISSTNINNFYEITSQLIHEDGIKSRTNKRSIFSK